MKKTKNILTFARRNMVATGSSVSVLYMMLIQKEKRFMLFKGQNLHVNFFMCYFAPCLRHK